MKKVKKFTTFEELKSCENNTMRYESSLKMHNDFEKVIMNIRTIKNIQDDKKE